MWYKWMALAFLTNGLSQFGLRVLQDLGLSKDYGALYLAFWYMAGLVITGAICFSSKPGKITINEIVIGSIMGLFSSGCWFMVNMALAYGVPGYLAFPVSVGGSLSIVAFLGVLLFKERLSGYGYAGIAAGILAMVLLVLP